MNQFLFFEPEDEELQIRGEVVKIKEYSMYELEKIKEGWICLEKGCDMTPFQSYEWNLFLKEQFREKK